jgi:hypothetical protein
MEQGASVVGNLGMLVVFASLAVWGEAEQAPPGLLWPALVVTFVGLGVAFLLQGRRSRGLARWGLTLAGAALLLALPAIVILA